MDAISLVARERQQHIVPSNNREPVAPKLASTVMLLREAERGLEVFVQQRVGTMKFAAHQTAFPGGSVDPLDYVAHSEIDSHSGNAVSSLWAKRLGTDLSTAAAITMAAVRETFEETGILLTRNAHGRLVSDTEGFCVQRDQLIRHELAFSQFLTDTGQLLDTDLLRYWSNWVTPEENPIRFDTHFFLAALPEGALADGNTSEATTASWNRPSDLLAAWRSEEVSLMPPTWAQIKRLADFDCLDSVMEFASTVRVTRTSTDFFDSKFMAEYFEKFPRTSPAAMGALGRARPLNQGVSHGA